MPETALPSNPDLDIRRESVAVVARVKANKVSDFEAGRLRADLLKAADAGAGRLLVDLSDVELLTSAGIGLLVELHKHCLGLGGKLVLCGLSRDIAEVLKLTRLDKVLSIKADRAAALALFK